MMLTINYGDSDATYQALGGFEGISRLVDDFYQIMDSQEQRYNPPIVSRQN